MTATEEDMTMKPKTLKDIAREIAENGNAYHERRISHVAHGKRARQLWDEVWGGPDQRGPPSRRRYDKVQRYLHALDFGRKMNATL